METALLDAAWEELKAVGYADMTFEAVADRAGTSRAVIYRRWAKRPELVIATLHRHRPVLSGQIPDTGELRSDVLALLQAMSARLDEIGLETVYGLLGDYLSDAEAFSRSQGGVLQVGTGVMSTILGRAAQRGEVAPGISPRVATLPTDLFRNELFFRRAPPSEAVVTEIVDDVFLPLVRSFAGPASAAVS